MAEVAEREGPGAVANMAGMSEQMYQSASSSLGMTSGGGAWDEVRKGLNEEFSTLKDAGYHPFYPDGMKDGNPIEIKGPGDNLKKNQAKKYAKAAGKDKCLVISAESCDPSGDITTPSGQCKRKAG